MNARGSCFVSYTTIARTAGITDRAAHSAVVELEAAGYLLVERSNGRRSNTYQAILPPTANALRCSEWEAALATANGVRGSRKVNSEARDTNSERHRTNSERPSPEALKAEEAGADSPTASQRAARTCGTCGGNKFDPDGNCVVDIDCNGRAT